MNFSVTGWVTSTCRITVDQGLTLFGNISVSVGAPFEVSTTGSGGWGTSVSYTPSSGSVSGTLFVRYNPTTGTGLNSSTITLLTTAVELPNQTINVNGKANPLITLFSRFATQSVKAGVAIGNIVYTVTGDDEVFSFSITFRSNFQQRIKYDQWYPRYGSSLSCIYNYTVTVVGPVGTTDGYTHWYDHRNRSQC